MPFSPKKHLPSRVRNMQPRHTLALVVTLSLILIVGAAYAWRVRQQQLIEADRARFAQADKEIAELSEAIIAEVGQPLKVDTSKYCSRPHLKYREGPLGCGVSSNLFFAVADSGAASRTYKQVSSEKPLHWGNEKSSQSNNLQKEDGFTDFDVRIYDPRNDYQQQFREYTNSRLSMQCRLTYNYYKADSPPFEEYKVSVISNEALAVTISCSDSAKAEHYPLND